MGATAKVLDLVDSQPYCDALNVCFFKPENCGACGKCRRALMALECLGAVDRFGKSFDLRAYYRRRNDIFKWLVLAHWQHDEFVEEMWKDFAPHVPARVWCAAVVSRIRSFLGLRAELRAVKAFLGNR